MKGQDALFSKASDEWETPQWLFDKLHEQFNFECDVAATNQNSKCFYYMDSSLDIPWDTYEGACFLNPPYSKVAAFMKKAYEESVACGVTVVCLIPSRTDTAYWHNYCMKASEIRFIKGRLKFTLNKVEMKNGATFPSCIVVFDERMQRDNWNNPLMYQLIK